jgi:hypothetical protein
MAMKNNWQSVIIDTDSPDLVASQAEPWEEKSFQNRMSQVLLSLFFDLPSGLAHKMGKRK